MVNLILLRHGESVWNKQNIFTGWVDVPLSEAGVEEAMLAGARIESLPIDVVFVSTLCRSLMTAMLALIHHSSKKVPVIIHSPEEGKSHEWSKIYGEAAKENILPVYQSWHLNERCYGQLQGLNKADMMEKFGKEQVQEWRRSFSTPPPQGESLEMTAARTLPYFKQTIVPFLQEGKSVLISAHGNSLRSIVMQLDGLTKDEVVNLELPTGDPILYRFRQGVFVKEGTPL